MDSSRLRPGSMHLSLQHSGQEFKQLGRMHGILLTLPMITEPLGA
jgi:hypothetical protein